jgi:hypothetical protein
MSTLALWRCDIRQMTQTFRINLMPLFSWQNTTPRRRVVHIDVIGRQELEQRVNKWRHTSQDLNLDCKPNAATSCSAASAHHQYDTPLSVRSLVQILFSVLSLIKVKFTLWHALKAQRVSRCITLLFCLTSALGVGWVVNATPRPLYPRKWPGTHWIGGWVCPRAGLDGCG